MKEELDDYIDDLEDDSSLRGIVKTQDPDYDPNEGVDQIQKKKKTKSKVDPKTSKKRKSGELLEVFSFFSFLSEKLHIWQARHLVCQTNMDQGSHRYTGSYWFYGHTSTEGAWIHPCSYKRYII